jgi:hypothetical protein
MTLENMMCSRQKYPLQKIQGKKRDEQHSARDGQHGIVPDGFHPG